jgi:hypothetical protein
MIITKNFFFATYITCSLTHSLTHAISIKLLSTCFHCFQSRIRCCGWSGEWLSLIDLVAVVGGKWSGEWLSLIDLVAVVGGEWSGEWLRVVSGVVSG